MSIEFIKNAAIKTNSIGIVSSSIIMCGTLAIAHLVMKIASPFLDKINMDKFIQLYLAGLIGSIAAAPLFLGELSILNVIITATITTAILSSIVVGLFTLQRIHSINTPLRGVTLLNS